MVVLHICKNEEDPIKNEDARVLTRLYAVFSDAQGQLTPKSALEFCRNSNSLLSSLPATLHEKSILREFTNIRKYSVNKWNCMHYPFAILFS